MPLPTKAAKRQTKALRALFISRWCLTFFNGSQNVSGRKLACFLINFVPYVLINRQKRTPMILNMEILIIFGVFMLLSWLVSNQLKTRFAKYSRIPLRSGLSGREIAEKMLRESGVDGVRVISTPGRLTDHYNPLDRTVNLSPEVYSGRSVAAAAVAAHECGHAVQHARAYAFLKMRSALVPVISVSSRYMQWVLLIGILTVESVPGILLAGIVMFAATTLFSFITLPVEFDATKRALAWLTNTGMTVGQEYSNAKDALKWAAMTYVVAALASLATLLYYIMIFLGRRN